MLADPRGLVSTTGATTATIAPTASAGTCPRRLCSGATGSAKTFRAPIVPSINPPRFIRQPEGHASGMPGRIALRVGPIKFMVIFPPMLVKAAQELKLWSQRRLGSGRGIARHPFLVSNRVPEATGVLYKKVLLQLASGAAFRGRRFLLRGHNNRVKHARSTELYEQFLRR